MPNTNKETNEKVTTVIIKRDVSNALGIASFIFGVLSIFVLAPLFVPLAFICGIFAVIKKQHIWGGLGLVCGIIGFFTSPILLAMLGLATLSVFDNNPKPTHVPVKPKQETRLLVNKPKSTHVSDQHISKSSQKKYYNLALANIKKKEYTQAIRDLNKSIQLDPNFAQAYYNRALSYYHLKNYAQAIEDCNKSIQLDPNFVIAYYGRGVSYYNLKKYEEAVENLSKFLNFKPNDANAYYTRGNGYYNLNKRTNACVDWQKACDLGLCKGITWAKKKGYCR